MAIATRQTKVIDIDGVSYTLVQLPATLAYKYYKKLSAEGLDSLNEEETKNIITESIQDISKDKYEILFAGKIWTLIQLVGRIIEFNFEDVFTVPDSEEQA